MWGGTDIQVVYQKKTMGKIFVRSTGSAWRGTSNTQR